MQQMIERQLAGQEHTKEMMESQLGSLVSRMEADRKTDREEMLAKMDANQEGMNASLKEEIKSGQAEMRSIVSTVGEKIDALIADMKDGRKERTAWQEAMEARLGCEEPTSVEHREVPTEEAAVKSSRTMKKRQRGRHPAAGRRGEPKERTRGDCGSRRKLAAACRKVFRRAAVAWRKRIVVRKDLTRNQVER
jgi:hypothetical protein